MGLVQRKWARRTRAALVVELGGVCCRCGTKGSRKNKLELDCREPRGERHHRMEWSHRMSFYRREHREGNLQLLCSRCHAKKTREDLTT